MNLSAAIPPRLFKPVLGAAMAMAGGLALWGLPGTEAWKNASYDALFRFGARTVTNQLAVILLEKDPDGTLRRQRPEHTLLLNKLADDGCPLVVLDVFYASTNENPAVDRELVAAIRRQQRAVLMANQQRVIRDVAGQPNLAAGTPVLPAEAFLEAAGTANWGVAWYDPEPRDQIVRRHWPFDERASYPSLSETAARLAGASLPDQDDMRPKRWLRYYGTGAWTSLSLPMALTNKADFFRGRIVFIGSKPTNTIADNEDDEFRTPYTPMTGETVGGVELHATSFLNLVNNEWLRRPAAWVEGVALVIAGALLGGGLGNARPRVATSLAAALALLVTCGAVTWSHFSDYWFPWLILVGGQLPCALGWAWLGSWVRLKPRGSAPTAKPPALLPETPDYELIEPAIGQGAYGKVWLARNSIGQWQALKAIYRVKFGDNGDPYEREFRGIKNYKPISDRHPGLLRVDFVSAKKEEGYFYYVMELGDAETPGWEDNPAAYRPRDLLSFLAQAPGKQLPVREAVRIALDLAEAVEFIHSQGLTHRDIKPSNVIFVNGRPKLADVGLVVATDPACGETTLVGTPGYMPPPPEPPGTVEADIYALGMVLYVISTGRAPDFFPEVSTTLVETTGQGRFMKLNAVILKACHPDRTKRYASAGAMRQALREVQEALSNAEGGTSGRQSS